MSTPLESEVTRETALTVEKDGVERQVEVTMVPMNVGAVEPEGLRFHLKGLTTKNDKIIPLPVLLRAIGWKVKLGKEIRAVPRTSAAPGQMSKVELEQLIQDLERQFGKFDKETA